MMTYQFALILFLVVISQAQTNKPPTVLCHSTCSKFFNNNNNIFTNEIDMAKNLTKIGFFSTSFMDVINHFAYYSSSFKQKQLATLLAMKEVSRYRNRTYTAYGATQIDDYITNTYPEGTCPLCSNLAQENGGVPPYPNMFEDYVLGETLTEEIGAASFMLDIPIFKFPFFQYSRLLQPTNLVPSPYAANNGIVCPANVDNLLQLANCLQGLVINMESVIAQYDMVSQMNNEQQQEVNVDPTGVVEGAAIPGLSNQVINKKYQEEILTSYTNCLNNIYEAC